MTCRLAIDVSRNAVDLALRRASDGRLFAARLATDRWAGPPILREAAADLAQRAGIALSDIQATVVSTDRTEAIARDRQGARIGLVTSAGHEDLLLLARGDSPPPLGGWTGLRAAPPLVDPGDIVGARGRLAANGDVLEQPDEAQWRHLLHVLLDRGVEGLAVSLLHAAVNPVHEHRFAELVEEMAPDLPVILSSDVARVAKEYERTTAAVLQAQLAAGFARHVQALVDGLPDLAGESGLLIARGDGGVMGPARAMARPLESLAARTAGCATRAARVADECGLDQALAVTVDVESSRLALVQGGAPLAGNRGRLGAWPLPVPGIEQVQAAGGLVRASEGTLGGLQLGPDRKAGLPAGFGGDAEAATLIDALLVLGHLPAQPLGEGPVRNLRGAEQALGALANALGLDLYQTATGMRDLFLEDLAGRLRTLQRRQGRTAERLPLVAGGSLGPVLAAPLAGLLGASTVIVPQAAGHAAAAGFIGAVRRLELGQAIGKPLADLGAARLVDRIAGLKQEALEQWHRESAAGTPPAVRLEALLQARASERTLSVSIDPEDSQRQSPAPLEEGFKTAYRTRYGVPPTGPLDVLELRIILSAPQDATASAVTPVAAGTSALDQVREQRQLHLGGVFAMADVCRREDLEAGHWLAGPAQILEAESATLVPPGWRAERDGHGHLHLRTDGDAG